MSSPILALYVLDGKGAATEQPDGDIQKALATKQLVWVHVDALQADSRQVLESLELAPHMVNALLAEDTRPRITEVGDDALLILRGVNLNENADPEDMVSLRMWVSKRLIVTARRRPLKAVLDVRARLEGGKGPKDAGELVNALTAGLFERMAPVLAALDEATDDVEEAVNMDADISLREQVVDIRRKAIIFRRYMAPQRDAISQLRMADFSWLTEEHKRHTQENLNHIMRYVEDLDAIRERAQIVKDELAAVLADRLNRNMYVLSVIAAVFLPLGFLTGLFGINIGGMPGVESPSAFSIFSAILTVLVILQIWIFKKLKWF